MLQAASKIVSSEKWKADYWKQLITIYNDQINMLAWFKTNVSNQHPVTQGWVVQRRTNSWFENKTLTLLLSNMNISEVPYSCVEENIIFGSITVTQSNWTLITFHFYPGFKYLYQTCVASGFTLGIWMGWQGGNTQYYSHTVRSIPSGWISGDGRWYRWN